MSPGVPSRIAEAKRDLGAMANALGVVGGGGSPNEMRSDGGIFIGYGVEETLKRHTDLIEVNIDVQEVIIALASTTGTQAFSFAQDHYLVAVEYDVPANLANVTWARLIQQPFGDPSQITLSLWEEAAGLSISPALLNPMLIPNFESHVLPIFGRRETDYIFSARTNVGGGATVRIKTLTVSAPQGVEIAH